MTVISWNHLVTASQWWAVDDIVHGTFVVAAGNASSAYQKVSAALEASDIYGYGWELGDASVTPIESTPTGQRIDTDRDSSFVMIV